MVLSGMLLWFTLLPSGLEQPLVQAVCGCRLSVVEAYGIISCSTLLCRRAVRTWRSGLCLRPCIFQSLVYGCCLWSTAYGFFGTRGLREALDEFQHFLLCGELES